MAPLLLSVTIITTALALAVVALRMFVRITIIRTVGWDDWTIIAAAVSSTVGRGSAFSLMLTGLGTDALPPRPAPSAS